MATGATAAVRAHATKSATAEGRHRERPYRCARITSRPAGEHCTRLVAATERQLEKAAERAEQSLRRFARDWSPARTDEPVGTAGNSNADWRARRDALVPRLDQRVRDMEQTLQRLDPRDLDQVELEHARERVELMKEDGKRIRGASENEWWELTRERVRAQLDRLDAAIDRLAQGRV
jgi:hypothetical protein